jgi:hypothetical protein
MDAFWGKLWMVAAMAKGIVLIGLGPHARRVYYPLLEKYARRYDIRMRLVVDLEDQASCVRRYLVGRSLQPERLFFVDSTQRDAQRLDGGLLGVLNQVALDASLHGVIISTEPKAHKAYALWALDHGLDVLMDKPLTAPVGVSTNLGASRRILEDYLELDRRRRATGSNLIVQSQRRNHVGYRFVKDYVADFVCRHGVPLSYIDVYHGDGMWCMPYEMFQRENHPYKYGYGKLLHSGYHFVDLFTWLSDVNRVLDHKRPNQANLFVKRFGVYDHLHQVNEADYRQLLGVEGFGRFFTPESMVVARALGELDAYVLCQLKRDDVVVTTANINLQQNTFSRRAWAHTPQDTYKGNGRIRHERLILQVGNLLSIQVHSYQSHEIGKKDVETTGAGNEDHFDIYVFRNSGVVRGEPLVKLSLGEIIRRRHCGDEAFLGHNEEAREVGLVDFLKGRPGEQDFATHYLTNKLLSKMYECMAREYAGDVPYLTFPLEAGSPAAGELSHSPAAWRSVLASQRIVPE